MTDIYDEATDAYCDLGEEHLGAMSMRDTVSLSLSLPHGADVYSNLRHRARHPFGMPSPNRAASALSGDATSPSRPRPVSPPIAGTRADGDLPSAA